jgi:hypothetical protein
VKAVVDAYTGKVAYYADLSEPTCRCGLGRSRSYSGHPQPADLQARSLRRTFPVQAYQYANPRDRPTLFIKCASGCTRLSNAASGIAPIAIRPYYQPIRLPGATTGGSGW